MSPVPGPGSPRKFVKLQTLGNRSKYILTYTGEIELKSNKQAGIEKRRGQKVGKILGHFLWTILQQKFRTCENTANEGLNVTFQGISKNCITK